MPNIFIRQRVKKREPLLTHFRPENPFRAAWEMAPSFSPPSYYECPLLVSESKGPYHASHVGRRFFTDESGLLGRRKMRRWRGLLLEKRAFGRWSDILIVTNNARREWREGRKGRGGLPLLYHAINITLHESYEFRAYSEGVTDLFVFRRRVDFVAINILDYATDYTLVNFILLRRLINM